LIQFTFPQLPMRSFFFLSSFLVSINLIGQAQEVKYSVCENCWMADSLGNHRAVIQVEGDSKVVRAVVPWRRQDQNPKEKNIIITNAQGKRILNIHRNNIDREKGEIYFEPQSGKGIYYVYYLPYHFKGTRNYPIAAYQSFIETADVEWVKRTTSTAIPEAKFIEFQSIDDFNSFYPMEVIATTDEVSRLKSLNNTQSYLVFPEDRLHSIKMKHDLPKRWIDAGPVDKFTADAMRGENFSFQLGVYAMSKELKDVKISFSDFNNTATNLIQSAGFSCLNAGGTNWDGKNFKKIIDIGAGEIQALWCLVNIPVATRAGVYEGKVTIQADNAPSKTIYIFLRITDKVLSEEGVDEPWKQTRLSWLNSTMAMNDEVIQPYVPLRVEGQAVSLLGRKVILGPSGLPGSIESYFSEEMTSIGRSPKQLLSESIQFLAEGADGKQLALTNNTFKFTETKEGIVRWEGLSTASDIQLSVQGQLEFDGFVSYSVKVTALNDVSLKDLRMEIPMTKASSKYMMGLGQQGGYRPASLKWKWDVANKNQDGAWIGDINGGLQFSLRDENYSRPLNTNFYLQKPLHLPDSWGNEGKGGVDISEKDNSTLINAYSGPRQMKRGDVLYYNFTMLITPFHTLRTDFQWKTRFYHKYSPIDTVLVRGSSVVNIHHANAINPYINYPFLRTKEMKAYIDEAHFKGVKVKIYNTIRELSNRAYETYPMRSLGTEIYSAGGGGGYSWLQEHLGENYIGAWFVPELKDAAIINSGMSRWHNYYVEGMNWLVKNVGIDGIYLDDVAFDRTTMKRIRRVLVSDRGPGIIDLHSANQYNKRDGFNNSANLYLEHFPYIDRLWFGEYFDYNKNPDFWMVEVSGIPFGLMGEMLEKGGNKWRGMLYGMTNRMPYDGNDPSHIWKVWDSFGMEKSEMIGYWVEKCPVKTNSANVLATVYKKKEGVLIALASWATGDVKVKLNIDWKSLGLTPKDTFEVPAVSGFQLGQTIKAGEEFVVPKGQGLMILVK
jgi:Family of unknown function (DUF6067)